MLAAMSTPIPDRLSALGKESAELKAHQLDLTARRRRAVFDAFEERYSFAEIGRMLGYSGERARQDYDRFLVDHPELGKQ